MASAAPPRRACSGRPRYCRRWARRSPRVPEQVRGGLAPWQIRKVTSHVEAHLDRPIRREELVTLVRLNPSYFGRAFRNSFGEPPHEYVIRRRVERAQGLMLSTDAPLSEIAVDCGLADQAHLMRLFRRIAGENPSAWRRARIGAPCECIGAHAGIEGRVSRFPAFSADRDMPPDGRRELPSPKWLRRSGVTSLRL